MTLWDDKSVFNILRGKTEDIKPFGKIRYVNLKTCFYSVKGMDFWRAFVDAESNLLVPQAMKLDFALEKQEYEYQTRGKNKEKKMKFDISMSLNALNIFKY